MRRNKRLRDTNGVCLYRCRTCKKAKRRGQFRKRYDRPNSWSTECIMCSRKREQKRKLTNLAARRWYKANWCQKYPEKRQEYYLTKKYGLSLAQFKQMREAQHGRCAICREIAETLVVDHDHALRKVRQLLCIPCNMTLGMVKDDALKLKAMAHYILRHKSLDKTDDIP